MSKCSACNWYTKVVTCEECQNCFCEICKDSFVIKSNVCRLCTPIYNERLITSTQFIEWLIQKNYITEELLLSLPADEFTRQLFNNEYTENIEQVYIQCNDENIFNLLTTE